MWSRAKTRAKNKSLEFNIEISDIQIPKRCPYLDIELRFVKGRSGGSYNSAALDRIDNSKGYIKGNIEVISHLANQMKASATKEQLILFSKRVLNRFNEQ